MRRPFTALLLMLLLPALAPAQAKLKPDPDDVPRFKLRARVIGIGGQKPDGKKFTFRLGSSKSAATAGDAWSDWLAFDTEQVHATLKGYPAIYLRSYPV